MPVQVPADTWLFSRDLERAQPHRAQMLWNAHWGDIVREVAAHASFLRHDEEHGRLEGMFAGCWRPTITVRVRNDTMDRYHNSAGGIRAQYYHSPQNGKQATREMCQRMLSRLVAMWTVQDGTGRARDVEASFASPYAKAWIDQGSWLMTKPHNLRNLVVARWVTANERGTPPRKPKSFPYWHFLMPDQEDRMDFKGAWVRDGIVFDPGTVFDEQAQQIHDYGYS